jgi:hypothetical protein
MAEPDDLPVENAGVVAMSGAGPGGYFRGGCEDCAPLNIGSPKPEDTPGAGKDIGDFWIEENPHSPDGLDNDDVRLCFYGGDTIPGVHIIYCWDSNMMFTRSPQ